MFNDTIYCFYCFNTIYMYGMGARQLVPWTTGTMPFWHRWTTGTIQLCQGGQLVPSSFSRVDNWDHAIFDIGGQLGPFPIYYSYTGTVSG